MKKLGLHFGRNDKGSAKTKLRLSGIRITTATHVESVVSLVKLKPDDYLRVTVDLDELDVTAAEKKPTYMKRRKEKMPKR